MQKLIGIIFLVAGIYFLGQNIMFSTYYSPFFWRSLPAMGSILALVVGVVSLIGFPRQTGNFGWAMLGLGVVLVFLSGGVFLKPTSLWSFVVAFASMTVGWKFIAHNRLRF